MAEGGYQQALGLAVISGEDPRRDGQTYVNQMFIGFGGGAGAAGPRRLGHLRRAGRRRHADPLPHRGGREHVPHPLRVPGSSPSTPSATASGTAAPGTLAVYGPVAGEMTAVYCSDGDTYPSKGVRGGSDGEPSVNQKRTADGTLVTLPSFHEESFAHPARCSASSQPPAAATASPPRRDPAAVARAVDNGWLRPEKASEVYAVALRLAPPTALGMRLTRRRPHGSVRHGTAGPRRIDGRSFPARRLPGLYRYRRHLYRLCRRARRARRTRLGPGPASAHLQDALHAGRVRSRAS